MSIKKDPNVRQQKDFTNNRLAIDHFTDREEARAAFQRHLNAPEGSPLPVLSFYGVGGSGKTLLLQKLVRDLQKVPYACLNFDDFSKTKNPTRALTSLWAQFESCGLRLPHFDLPRAVIMARDDGEAEPIFQSSPSLELALAVVEHVLNQPISVAREAGSQLFRSLRNKWPGIEKVVHTWGGTEEILELRKLDDKLLQRELARVLALDLAERLPERSNKACRGVIFFDAYEKLWHGTSGPMGPQGGNYDWWVRDLFSYLADSGHVLLVIAGQNRLHWPKTDPDWRALSEEELTVYLDEHLVGGLSAQDTQRYLSQCGVGRPPEDDNMDTLQKAIFQCAGGEEKGALPFFVALCANIVRSERNSHKGVDPSPHTFEEIPNTDTARRLAERFLTSLADVSLADLVRWLSIPRWFDRDLILDLTPGYAIDSTMSILRSLSFIQMLPDGVMGMHGLMRDALRLSAEGEQVQHLVERHQWFRKHWRGRFGAGEERAEREEWYHWVHTDAVSAARHWCDLAAEADSSSRMNDVVVWWEDVDLAGLLEGEDDHEAAVCLREVGGALLELRHSVWPPGPVLERAIECAEAAAARSSKTHDQILWASCRELCGIAHQASHLVCVDDQWFQTANTAFEDALEVYGHEERAVDWARTQTYLGEAWRRRRIADRTICLQNAIRCFKAAEELLDCHSSEWAEVQLNLGDVYWMLGKRIDPSHYVSAKRHLIHALTVYGKNEFPERWAEVQNDLGMISRSLRSGDRRANLEEALHHHMQALEVRTEEDFPGKFAASMNNLAWVHMDYQWEEYAKHSEQAIACLQACLRLNSSDHTPMGWALRHHNLARAWELLPVGDREQNLLNAIDHARIALSVRTHDDDARSWALTQIRLGSALMRVGRGGRRSNVTEAICCFDKALSYFDKEDEPRRWGEARTALGHAHMMLSRLGEPEAARRAIEFYQDALSVYDADDLPYNWAIVQRLLTEAYIHDDRLAEAASGLEAALQVLTEDQYPIDCGLTLDIEATLRRHLSRQSGGGFEDATAAHEQALSLLTQRSAPHFWADATCNLALTLLYAQRSEEAAERVRSVLKEEADHATALCILAAAEATTGDVAQSARDLTESLRLDPEIIRPMISNEPVLGDAFANDCFSHVLRQV